MAATRCACHRRRHYPLVIRQVCHESRREFLRSGMYSKCFGTVVNWAIHIIYIGERTDHFHNTKFLKAVELGGGLNQLRYLATYYDVWDESTWTHGHAHLEFKHCSPAGILQS